MRNACVKFLIGFLFSVNANAAVRRVKVSCSELDSYKNVDTIISFKAGGLGTATLSSPQFVLTKPYVKTLFQKVHPDSTGSSAIIPVTTETQRNFRCGLDRSRHNVTLSSSDVNELVQLDGFVPVCPNDPAASLSISILHELNSATAKVYSDGNDGTQIVDCAWTEL